MHIAQHLCTAFLILESDYNLSLLLLDSFWLTLFLVLFAKHLLFFLSTYSYSIEKLQLPPLFLFIIFNNARRYGTLYALFQMKSIPSSGAVKLWVLWPVFWAERLHYFTRAEGENVSLLLLEWHTCYELDCVGWLLVLVCLSCLEPLP